MLEVYLTGVIVWLFQEANHVWMEGNNRRKDYLWSFGLALIWPTAVLFLGIAMLAVIFVNIKERWKG